jgi:hypothetical protein
LLTAKGKEALYARYSYILRPKSSLCNGMCRLTIQVAQTGKYQSAALVRRYFNQKLLAYLMGVSDLSKNGVVMKFILIIGLMFASFISIKLALASNCDST